MQDMATPGQLQCPGQHVPKGPFPSSGQKENKSAFLFTFLLCPRKHRAGCTRHEHTVD